MEQKCFLFLLPPEIREKIWILVIKKDKPIRPTQLQPWSNTFAHGSILKDLGAPLHASDHFISAEPPLSMLAFSLTCHQMHEEVIGENLFYKHNEFDFDDLETMMNYLFAITQPRMQSIRDITCRWDSWSAMQRHGITVLEACSSLRNLRLKIDRLDSDLKYWPGFNSLMKLRGLQTFRLTYVPRTRTTNYVRQRQGYEQCFVYEGIIGNEVTKPRSAQPPRRKLNDAQARAKLNVLGDGRAGPDVKPGIVASRTRAQLAKQKSINHLGVFNDSAPPKYDLEHNLLWRVEEIVMGRETVHYGSTVPELCVKWYNGGQLSWEPLSDLLEQNALADVKTFPADLDLVRASIELDSQSRSFSSIKEQKRWVREKVAEVKKRQRRRPRVTFKVSRTASQNTSSPFWIKATRNTCQ